MLPEVVMEVLAGGQWQRIGAAAAETAGSISSDEPDGRQVYVFGWLDDTTPGVWRSAFGLDIESGALRAITSIALERLTDLATPYEIVWCRPYMTVPIRFRLSATNPLGGRW